MEHCGTYGLRVQERMTGTGDEHSVVCLGTENSCSVYHLEENVLIKKPGSGK